MSGHTLKDLFAFTSANKDGIEAAGGLTDLVFKAGAGAAGATFSLFQLLKILKGKKPEKAERLADGNISIVAHDGSTVIINQKVEKLYSNPQVRKAAEDVARSAQSQGIERLRFIQERAFDEIPLVIERGDVPSFEVPPPSEEPEAIEEQERIMVLQFRNIWLTGETQKWEFTEGGESFRASIEDTEFLNKVMKGEIAFAANDYMRARVRVRQTRTGKGLRIERTILEVIGHEPGSSQLRLL